MKNFWTFALATLGALTITLGTLQVAFADGNPGWDDCAAKIRCASLVESPPGSGIWICTSQPTWRGCVGGCQPCVQVTGSQNTQCPQGTTTCKCTSGDDGGWDVCVTCVTKNGLGVVTGLSCSSWFCPPTSDCELYWNTSSGDGKCECFAPGGP